MICQISQGHNAPPSFDSSGMRTNKSKIELKLGASKEVLLLADGSRSPTDSTNNGWVSTEKTAAAAAMALVKHTNQYSCPPEHGAHVACGVCAQRAANIVEVGAYPCCWQCVADKYDQVKAKRTGANGCCTLYRYLIPYLDWLHDISVSINRLTT
jgi:hypothetical protein